VPLHGSVLIFTTKARRYQEKVVEVYSSDTLDRHRETTFVVVAIQKKEKTGLLRPPLAFSQ